ncbi:MAG: hypothetical protein AB1473_13705 [Thermodesulfobacteriota bacterium]
MIILMLLCVALCFSVLLIYHISRILDKIRAWASSAIKLLKDRREREKENELRFQIAYRIAEMTKGVILENFPNASKSVVDIIWKEMLDHWWYGNPHVLQIDINCLDLLKVAVNSPEGLMGSSEVTVFYKGAKLGTLIFPAIDSLF